MRHRDRLTFLARRLPPRFEVALVTIAPGGNRTYDPAEWRTLWSWSNGARLNSSARTAARSALSPSRCSGCVFVVGGLKSVPRC
jgi:hypothetical protein